MRPNSLSKILRCWLMIACLNALCLSHTVHAEGWSLRDIGDEPGSFLSGLASGVALHELGHVLVASSKGYTVGHDGVSIVYGARKMSSNDQQRIASAGFQAQWIASEFAFSAREKTDSEFAAGIICAHLAISAAYLTVLKNQSLGDTVGYANATGLGTDRVVLIAAIPAVLDTWRLFGDDVPKWIPALSIASKGTLITAIWVH